MTRPKKIFLLAAGAAGALILALVYALVWRPLPVVLAISGQQAPLQVFGLGSVEARVLSKVGFKISGTLAELKADHGDVVKAGQILALLDNSEQQNRVAKAAASRLKAQASLQVAKAGLAKARTNLTLKQQNNHRRQALLRRGVLAGEAGEEAKASADNAAAEAALAEAEVAAANAALEDATAQLGLDKVLLAQHVLVAPFDALVITRHKELGTALPAGEPVFSLADPCTVWVRAFVDETKAGHLAVDQAAEVRLRSLPGRVFPGQVARIDIESDRVGEERRVNVTWEHCPSQFHLGEQAEVLITTGSLERAILVPQTLVEGYDGTGGDIWTLEEGRLHRRRVVLGQGTLDGRLPVVGGLPPGSQPLAALPGGLRAGRRATPLAEGRP